MNGLHLIVSQLDTPTHFTRARDPVCNHAESTTRRLEAQLAEAAERNRRMERLSQVKPRCE